MKLFLFLFLLVFSFKIEARLILKGKVTEATTQKPITGANIVLSPGNKGTKTDAEGNYSFELPFGEYYITVTAIGFYKRTRFIKMDDDVTLNFDMQEEISTLNEVIVNSKKADANVKDVQMGSIKLNMNSLKRIPVVFGETDVLRALTLQPGVSTVGEGSGGINVRGGKVDQNLVTIDGAPLFNTSHLLGFFTAISADAINDVTLYKGSVPANYGGRLSGVLDMNIKNGNPDSMRYQVGVGLISSKFVADGPISKKTTILLSTRIAYPNVGIKYFPEPTNQSRAFFYDLNAKVGHTINKNNKVTMSLYRSYDNFKFPEDTLYSWNMNTGTINWAHQYSNTLNQYAQLNYSDYSFDVIGQQKSNEFKVNSKIVHKELKTGLIYQKEKYKAELGANVILYGVSPSTQTPNAPNSNVIEDILPQEKAREMAVFMENNLKLSKRISLSVGLRYSFFQFLGPKTINVYDLAQPRILQNVIDTKTFKEGETVANYGGLEPRVSLKVDLGPNSSIKTSYNRMRQYLHLISNTTAISPIDYWKLSDSFIPPQVSDQLAIGLFKNIAENNYELGLETYYKFLSNLVEYKKGATLSKNRNLETALLTASGVAYGTEFFVKKNRGDFTGILSYTYSRSFLRANTPFVLEQINEGSYYPSSFDKPHILNISGLKNLNYGFSFLFNFVYNSGRPITYPDGVYNFNGLPVVNYQFRNLDRIPDYHRLDLSINYDTKKTKDQKNYSLWNFSIYNAYSRKNAYSIYFTSVNRITRPYQLSVFGSAIPSISYNKYF